MPNRCEKIPRNADFASATSARVKTLNFSTSFTFTRDNYRWFYICRRRA